MSVVLPIEEDERFRLYTATAGQTQFSVPFPFQQDEDIILAIRGAHGQFETISPALYGLSGAGTPDGGMATFYAGRQANEEILVLGLAILDRLGSVVALGRFNSRLTDDELDRSRIIQQELRRDTSRALKTDYGAAEQILPPPDGVSLLGWEGDRLVNRVDAGERATAAEAAAAAALGAANAGYLFDTKVQASLARVSDTLDLLRIAGERDLADTGAIALFRQVPDSGPLRSFEFRSNFNTKRWALSDRDVDIRNIGCTSDEDFDSNASRIQDLMDARSGYGGRIIIPATEDPFVLVDEDADTFCLRVPSGTSLLGFGRHSALRLRSEHGAPAQMLRMKDGAEACIIEKLLIDGNRDNQTYTPNANQPGQYAGICGSRYNKNITYRDIDIVNVLGRSLSTNQYGSLAGELTDAAEDITIENVRVRNGGTKAILVRRTKRAVVMGCHVVTNGVPDDNLNNTDNCSAFEASNSQGVNFVGCLAEHLNAPWGVTCRGTNGSLYVNWIACQGKGGRQFASITTSHSSIIGGVSRDAAALGGDAAVLIQAHAGENIRDVSISGLNIVNPTGYGIAAGVEVPGNGSLRRVNVTNCIIRGGDPEAGVSSAMTYALRSLSAASDVDLYESGNVITQPTVSARIGPWKLSGVEEGAFTPEWRFATLGNASMSYTTQSGYWWDDGHIIRYKIVLIATVTHTTASGDLRIGGLPRAILNDADRRGLGSGSFRGITMAGYTQFSAVSIQGTNELGIRASGSGQNDQNVTAAQVPSGGSLRAEIEGWYVKA